jgi:ArsR family transcriptional regulator
MNDDATDIALVAKALAHPARVRIVQLLAQQDACMGAEVFARLPLAQSTVSEHLRVLRDAGVVSSTPEGTRTLYCLRAEVLEEFAARLGDLAEQAARCEKGLCR